MSDEPVPVYRITAGEIMQRIKGLDGGAATIAARVEALEKAVVIARQRSRRLLTAVAILAAGYIPAGIWLVGDMNRKLEGKISAGQKVVKLDTIEVGTVRAKFVVATIVNSPHFMAGKIGEPVRSIWGIDENNRGSEPFLTFFDQQQIKIAEGGIISGARRLTLGLSDGHPYQTFFRPGIPGTIESGPPAIMTTCDGIGGRATTLYSSDPGEGNLVTIGADDSGPAVNMMKGGRQFFRIPRPE